MWSPRFECVVGVDGEASYRVGHVLVDDVERAEATAAVERVVQEVERQGPFSVAGAASDGATAPRRNLPPCPEVR